MIATALALSALALPQAASADWPVYGHDLSNTRNAGSAGPPADRVTALKRAWTFDSPTGDFTGTPVVAGGVVVAGDFGGTVYGIDAVTGKKRWSHKVGAPVNGSAAIDLDAPGGATAYVPVAQSGSPRLVALSLADGAPRWDAVLTHQPNASVYGSPVFWHRTLYIGTSGPNNDDSTARGSVVALDEANGNVRWQTFLAPPGRDGVAVFSTPAIDTSTGRLFVGTGNNYHQPTTDMEDSVVAMDAASGQVLGHYQATKDDSFAADNPAGPDADFGASPNLFTAPDGRRMVGEGQKSGVYWALDRRTLVPAWSATVGPSGPLGGILGTPAVDADHIYGGDSLDGQVFAIDRGTGMIRWQSAEPGGLHVEPYTVAHGVVYNADPSGALVARDPATGTALARFDLDGPALGGVSAAGGALFVAVGTGPLPEPAPQNDNPGSIDAFGDTSGAAATPPPTATPHKRKRHLALRVRPRHVRAHRLVRLHVRVLHRGHPVRRATVRLGRRHVRTRRDGRASLKVRFGRPGVRVLRATRRGYAGARTTVRVRR